MSPLEEIAEAQSELEEERLVDVTIRDGSATTTLQAIVTYPGSGYSHPDSRIDVSGPEQSKIFVPNSQDFVPRPGMILTCPLGMRHRLGEVKRLTLGYMAPATVSR